MLWFIGSWWSKASVTKKFGALKLLHFWERPSFFDFSFLLLELLGPTFASSSIFQGDKDDMGLLNKGGWPDCRIKAWRCTPLSWPSSRSSFHPNHILWRRPPAGKCVSENQTKIFLDSGDSFFLLPVDDLFITVWASVVILRVWKRDVSKALSHLRVFESF